MSNSSKYNWVVPCAPTETDSPNTHPSSEITKKTACKERPLRICANGEEHLVSDSNHGDQLTLLNEQKANDNSESNSSNSAINQLKDLIRIMLQLLLSPFDVEILQMLQPKTELEPENQAQAKNFTYLQNKSRELQQAKHELEPPRKVLKTENYLQAKQNYLQAKKDYYEEAKNYNQATQNYLQAKQDYSEETENYLQATQYYSEETENYLQAKQTHLQAKQDYYEETENYLQATQNYLQAKQKLLQMKATYLQALSPNDNQTQELRKIEEALKKTNLSLSLQIHKEASMFNSWLNDLLETNQSSSITEKTETETETQDAILTALSFLLKYSEEKAQLFHSLYQHSESFNSSLTQAKSTISPQNLLSKLTNARVNQTPNHIPS